MNDISFKALKNKALELKDSGAKWHFHMIGPKCIFNRVEHQYEIFIENEITDEMWFSLFNERPVEQTRQMAKMAYGTDFLKKNNNTDFSEKKIAPNKVFQNIMSYARECNAKDTTWHNHHLLPQCHLNSRKGSHCIVFEDEISGSNLFAYFDEDPIEELSQLEYLYFNK